MPLAETYMHRCLQLAALAAGNVAPNPMVGAVLVHQGRIIGEGYHQHYGGPHAEVACLASVQKKDRHLIAQATLYVSLEPCAHWGKTPPCAELLIKNKIPIVVVGCRDPFAEVDGKGIEKLRAAGIEVTVGMLEDACKELNGRFFTFHTKHRPYVLLKWAQTGDGKIAPMPPKAGLMNAQSSLSNRPESILASLQSKEHSANSSPVGRSPMETERLFISNAFSNRIVHKWRSEEAAILIGANTALHDNPTLNTRLWPGRNPVRLVVDNNLRLPQSLHIFDGSIPTIIFNKHQHSLPAEKTSAQQLTGVNYYKIDQGQNLVPQLLDALYALNIQSVLVEGGAQLLQSFIDEGLWDEARIITNEKLHIGDGLAAPRLSNALLIKTEMIFSDTLQVFRNSI